MEVPILDVDERHDDATGQRRPRARFLRKKVGVRLHGERVDVDRQRIRVGVDVVAASRGDIDVLPPKPQHVAGTRRTLVGEEQADAHAHGLWYVARHEMELDHQIALWLETPAHGIGRHARRLARRPAEKHPVGKSGLTAAAALVSGARLIVVAPPRETRAIDFDVGVMHDLGMIGKNHGPDVRGRRKGIGMTNVPKTSRRCAGNT